MKNYIIALGTIIFISLSCKSSLPVIENKNLYEVYKIDSINEYYLIYAKRGDSLFKIVSKKEAADKQQEIKVNKSYPLKLHSRRENLPTIGGIKLEPINYLDVECFAYDKSTTICIERDSINDLHYAENIKGKYFIKN
nr:hypothetical protein [Flavobacterium sp. ASV13]